MAEITQINFTNKELLTLLLKDQGIHEGNWILGASFTFSAINFGQAPDGSDASPTAVAALAGISILRTQDAPPFSVNAAEVNPKN